MILRKFEKIRSSSCSRTQVETRRPYSIVLARCARNAPAGSCRQPNAGLRESRCGLPLARLDFTAPIFAPSCGDAIYLVYLTFSSKWVFLFLNFSRNFRFSKYRTEMNRVKYITQKRSSLKRQFTGLEGLINNEEVDLNNAKLRMEKLKEYRRDSRSLFYDRC